MATPSPELALQERFRDDPAFFHREVLGHEPWGKQLAISESIRDHRNTAIRSNNGSGKTYHMAREALRFLYAYGPNAVVINTAPTWTQVENQFWRNLRDAYQKARYPLGGNLLKTKLDIDETWFALGIANDEHNMEGFQGWHAEAMLVIFDEASGISPKIYEAALGAMAGGHTVRFVLIGNPTQNSGPFYDAFKDPTFNKIHISAFDTPNVQAKAQVVPGLVTWDFVQEVRTKYGEDSDVYPVYTTDVLPAYSSSAVSTKFGVFGNLELALAWGDRGPMEVAKSDSATVGGKSVFRANQTAVRFTHRHAITMQLPAAAVVLKTAAS